MFSWITKIWYALLFVWLIILFFASGFATKLFNGITALKTNLWYLVDFFWNADPIFSIIASLMAVLFVLLLVFWFKNTN